jgi:hypothetical protein
VDRSSLHASVEASSQRLSKTMLGGKSWLPSPHPCTMMPHHPELSSEKSREEYNIQFPSIL